MESGKRPNCNVNRYTIYSSFSAEICSKQCIDRDISMGSVVYTPPGDTPGIIHPQRELRCEWTGRFKKQVGEAKVSGVVGGCVRSR